MSDTMNTKPLRFLHIGDVHLTEAGLQNHRDLGRIIDEVNTHVGKRADFVFLPGDNADDGTAAQFKIVHDEMARLQLPWHAIPGDHDFKERSLDNFYRGLNGARLPYRRDISGCCCIFLDVVSKGSGGPEFRLGPSGIAWLRETLAEARRDGQSAVVFMHTYPADLRDEADELAVLFDESPVVLVDMGHTHYNELANDGRTIYAATRSTGQIEEGDPGFAFVAVDGGVVSWRFKTLDSPWPFVMITAPADRRLMTAPHPVTDGGCMVRASAFGAAPIVEAVFRIDHGDWHAMHGSDDGMFSAVALLPDKQFTLSVRVTDQNRAQDTDTIEFGPLPERLGKPTGSDAASIGAWPERHLLGTQLGPNRNGRKW